MVVSNPPHPILPSPTSPCLLEPRLGEGRRGGGGAGGNTLLQNLQTSKNLPNLQTSYRVKGPPRHVDASNSHQTFQTSQNLQTSRHRRTLTSQNLQATRRTLRPSATACLRRRVNLLLSYCIPEQGAGRLPPCGLNWHHHHHHHQHHHHHHREF